MGGGFSCCRITDPEAIDPGAAHPLLPSNPRFGEGNRTPGSDSSRALAEGILSEENRGGRNSDRRYAQSINSNQSDFDESHVVNDLRVVRITSRKRTVVVIDPISDEESQSRAQTAEEEMLNKEFLDTTVQHPSAEAVSSPWVNLSQKRTPRGYLEIPFFRKVREGSRTPELCPLLSLSEVISSEGNRGGGDSVERFCVGMHTYQYDSEDSLGETEPGVFGSVYSARMTDLLHASFPEESRSMRKRAVVEKANKEFREKRDNRPSAEAVGSAIMNSSQKRPLKECFQICSTTNLIGICLREEDKRRQKILEDYRDSWKRDLSNEIDKFLVKIYS